MKIFTGCFHFSTGSINGGCSRFFRDQCQFTKISTFIHTGQILFMSIFLWNQKKRNLILKIIIIILILIPLLLFEQCLLGQSTYHPLHHPSKKNPKKFPRNLILKKKQNYTYLFND